jgi:hypothetical protein
MIKLSGDCNCLLKSACFLIRGINEHWSMSLCGGLKIYMFFSQNFGETENQIAKCRVIENAFPVKDFEHCRAKCFNLSLSLIHAVHYFCVVLCDMPKFL